MKFSIIIVAYNIENFIEQALLSCLFSGRDDYEIIVVENHSDDDTLKFARRVATRHPGIFRIIENGQNYGLGIGRNIGMGLARGEYILFLDGDDWFASNLLDRLSTLVDLHGSDIFTFSHAKTYDDGKVVENRLAHLLYEGPRDTPGKRAEVMQNFGVAWNKAYKRSFIEERGIKSGERFYEDIDWNFEVALLSKTFYAIPDVLVYYRQRTGSITRSVDIRHFDILSQYRLVIDLLKRHPDLSAHYGTGIYHYCRGQCLNVLAANRLPPGSHSKFLRQLDELLRDFRETVGIKRRTVKDRLVGTRNIRLFRTGVKAIAAINGSKKLPQKIATLWSRRAELRSTLKRRRDTISPHKTELDEKLVLLESFWGKKIDCNPLALAHALEKRGYRCVWSVTADAAAPAGARTVRKHSSDYRSTLAAAKYLISNANLPDYWTKKNGQVHIQTFHGTPLKFMGLDIIKTNPGEMDWTKYAMRSKRWDYAISSNEYSTRIWRQNSPYNYRVLETGYPRNDIFFASDPALAERVRRELGVPEGKKIALYAPTFREPDRNAVKNLAQSPVFDADAAQRALGDEWVLLVRGHYFIESGSQTHNPSVIDASGHVITNEVCLVSDLLISDYSSIMFDFACLRRPIILYAYDLEEYVRTRGMYFNIEKQSPGAVARDFHDLLRVLSSQTFLSEDNKKKLEEFNREFCSFDDGQSTDRVLAAVFGETSS